MNFFKLTCPCRNSVWRKVRCTNGCKVNNLKKPCTIHGRKYPGLSLVDFHPFPTNKEHRVKWLQLCNRTDISLDDVTRNYNYRICSVHFESGLGCTKLYPVPGESPQSTSEGKENKTVDKRLSLEEMPSKNKPELNEAERLPLRSLDFNLLEVSGTYSASCPQPEAALVEPGNGNCPKKPPPCTAATDHSYAGVFFPASSPATIGTQTEMTTDMLCDLESTLASLRADLDTHDNLRAKLFTEQITNDDNSVHFYTGFPNRALLLSTFDIVKNVAERMRYHNGSKTETLNPQSY